MFGIDIANSPGIDETLGSGADLHVGGLRYGLKFITDGIITALVGGRFKYRGSYNVDGHCLYGVDDFPSGISTAWLATGDVGLFFDGYGYGVGYCSFGRRVFCYALGMGTIFFSCDDDNANWRSCILETVYLGPLLNLILEVKINK